MKRAISLLITICLAWAMPIAAAAEARVAAPFTIDDLNQITAELKTVGDYAELLQPNMYSWMDVDGKTQLELMSTDGAAVLGIDAGATGINGEADGVAGELDQAILSLEATLLSATWFESRYALPLIRDVGIGVPKQSLLDAFQNNGSPLYSAQAVSPAADASTVPEWAYIGGDVFPADDDNEFERVVYGWCDFSAAVSGRTYYTLSYEIKDDCIFTIEFFSAMDG